MKLTDIDLYDPGEVLSAIKLLAEQYVKCWGEDDKFMEVVQSLTSEARKET